MKLTKSIRLALNILVHSKLRSWLSIIGIVIGVTSVIAIMALGEGMQQSMEERLGGLGADTITISPGFSKAAGARGEFRGHPGFQDDNLGITTIANLTNKEVQALKLISNIDSIQGIVSGNADLNYLSETILVNVKGVDTKVWKNIETAKLKFGRYLSQGDKNVVVIGENIAEGKFKQDIQLNRQITIEGKIFRVVGILEDERTIFMPIETARIILEDVGDKEFRLIEIKVKDVNIIDETLEQIEKRLMLVRAVTERNKDFTVSSVKALQETISETIDTMQLFLSAIAAISLLVGAVGIANTMFTTVLEKTKEIGIMKSIGAKNKDIMLIFLFNSGMIGLGGGIIGGIFGIFVSKLVSIFLTNMMKMPSGGAIVTPYIVLLVLSISILIGVIAGVVPAYRASRMDPVDALRHE